MISLSGLNSRQRKAAEAVEGPVLILAGAGSGKTRTITYRIAHMVYNLGIDPKTILGVSFTNKASKEMKERVTALLPKSKTRGLTLATFHSLGVRILKKEIKHLGYLGNFSIYDTGDQLAIIREALKSLKTEKGAFDRKVILAKIGWLKNRGISEEDFAKSPWFNPDDPYDDAVEYCFRFYQDKLRFYNAIDFDDILYLTVKLFRQHPEIARIYSEKYQYIMIDEYQDTNTLQFQLVLALTSTHNNLCVVGDDDQAIYGFRGADVTNILSFEQHFKNCRVIKLEENYRSTSSILDLANNVIAKNKGRKEKTLWSKKTSDHVPLLWIMGDTDHEAEVIVEEIVQHQAGGGHLGDIAILYRSKTQLPPFEDQLRLSQVPYSIIGGQKLYERKEIKDLIAYLCVVQNPKDELSLRRILNVPNRGIGKATLEKYLEKAGELKCSLFEAMKEVPDLDPARHNSIASFIKLVDQLKVSFKNNKLAQAVSTMVDDVKYMEFIDKTYDDNAKQAARRKNDIMQFVESASRFERYLQAHANLDTFIEKLLLQDSQDQEDEDEDGDIRKNEVTLMTLHSSKGLEFDHVYFVGVEEETLPHKKTISEGSDINEELRLCYVGITRARERLVMTCCKERKIYGRDVPRHKSRFLLELPPGSYIEQDRTTFGHLSPEEAEKYKRNFISNLMDSLED